MLEAAQHAENAFVTLTYSENELVTASGRSVSSGENGFASLQPDHLQNFFKRFRKAIEPLRIRYYAVGEYGDETWRPHYHAALFSYPTCRRGRTLRLPGSGRPRWDKCCVQCSLVGRSWTHGDVDLGTLETSSAQYLAGYVTKKMTHAEDFRLDGRLPEFSRMSLRPGIGHGAMHDVASQLMKFNLENTQADVPSALRHGSRLMPLGRYLRRNLRKMVGKDEKTPDVVSQALAEEMRPLRESAFNASQSFKQAVLDSSKGEIDRVLAKHKLYKRKGSL